MKTFLVRFIVSSTSFSIIVSKSFRTADWNDALTYASQEIVKFIAEPHTVYGDITLAKTEIVSITCVDSTEDELASTLDTPATTDHEFSFNG